MANLILTLISILLISFFVAKRFLSNQIHVDWSPTGQWIVFYCGLFTNSSSTSWGHLYIMRPDGSSLQQITGDGVIARSPTWSPDGKWIAFINGENEIVKVKPDATASETIFRAAYSVRIDDIDWSPIHNSIVFNTSSYLYATSILIFNVDDKTQELIMSSDNHPGRLKWSPDG